MESTIAEKFDSILKRMDGTSRMKDFYDIYYLSGMYDFDGKILLEAIRSTLTHRNREQPEDGVEAIADFTNNSILNTRWRAFDPVKETGLPFNTVIERVIVFLEPIYRNILQGNEFDKQWNCESKTWA